MIRKRTALVLAIGAMFALPANASAQRPTDPPAADRACLGMFHSGVASPAFAEFVPFIAHEFQPLGAIVSQEAITCEIVFD